MIKLAGIVSFILLSHFSHAQGSPPPADEVLKPLFVRAATENKKLLVIYHASWCVWCRKMDTAISDRDVWPLINKFYIIEHLTVYESNENKEMENPGALELLTKHGGANKGIPYWVVLDKEGHLVANSDYKPGHNSGCPATEAEVAYFIHVLQQTSSLNEEELKVIAKRFRLNGN